MSRGGWVTDDEARDICTLFVQVRLHCLSDYEAYHKTVARLARRASFRDWRTVQRALRGEYFEHEIPTVPLRTAAFRVPLVGPLDLDLSTCPLCRRGSLRIIAAITHEAMIMRMLRHLKLAKEATCAGYWRETNQNGHYYSLDFCF